MGTGCHMKTSNPLSAGNFGHLIRVIGLGGAVLLASACSAPSVTTEPIPVTAPNTVERSADQVGDALSEVSLQISAQMTGEDEDVLLAWSDFESDVRSVVNDLIRRPSRVDIEGMQLRVDALGEFLDDSQLELPASEWDEFVSAFQTLMDAASAANESA